MDNISKLGYKDNSPYKDASQLDINSNLISMRGVSRPLIGIGDDGTIKVMKPNRNYIYPNANSVTEIPVKQKGGVMHNYNDFEKYLMTLSEQDQDKLIDYVESMDSQSQQKFLKGGKIVWKSYQRGGQTNLQQVEVEGEESAQTPDGKFINFKGPKHSQGGINTMLPEGTRVFSEHTKVDPKQASELLGKTINKKMSYADMSKRFNTDKYVKILNNKDSDLYQKETAKLKLAHNNMMLDTIFQHQELSKVKDSRNKMQGGGYIESEESPLERLKRTYDMKNINLPEVVITPDNNQIDWNTLGFGQEGKEPNYQRPRLNLPQNISPELGNQFPIIHQEPSSTVSTGVVLGDQRGWKEPLTPKATNILNIVDPNRSSIAPVREQPKQGQSQSKSKSRGNQEKQEEPFVYKKMEPLSPLMRTINTNVQSKPREFNSEDYTVENNITQNPIQPKSQFNLGISSKLAGTLLDIGLAASDKLTVNNPQFRDLRKYPLFSRFVDFDDKEVGRNMALNIQQIQNSNLPEEVKQSRIADLNSQYKDYQAKIDFGNAQRYEQKLNQDTEKLQNYINANIDQHYQDIETYRAKKARVDELRNQFQAQKKSRIVNSVRNYLDYVDRTNLENQIYADNYAINPITGKINFKGATPDKLKEQEKLMNQYAQNSAPVQNLPGGAYLTVLPGGQQVIINSKGDVTTVK